MLNRKIKAKERQLEALKAHAVYTTPQFSERVCSSPAAKSLMEKTAVEIMDLETCISSQISEFVRLCREIAEVIKAVNNTEYETVLEMRYLTFMSWEEIASCMNYGTRYVYKVHGRALEMIENPSGVQ